jgi:hypothetical protein
MDASNTITRPTPAKVSTILKRHSDSEPFDNSFNYRSVIGKMGYLNQSTRADIAVALHQCARFSANPKKEHGQAVRYIGRYLAGTRDKGLIIRPTEQSFDVFVDADFSGNWDPEGASTDMDTAKSRTGYVITYAGCPILWGSKLQSIIALSTTEAEFVALSQTLRIALPLMWLIREMKQLGFECQATKPQVHCRVFEDNSGAIELATVPKMRPRTKHINLSYHWFRSLVPQDISIHAISTAEQCADLMTKALSEILHVKY